jgi:1-acyl-sn-glycerol-3-phosphate acyltransferase
LLLFPEGTRTRRELGSLNDFRPGLALLAKRSGAPVLPVFITTDSPYLGKGWPTWKMPKLPVSISFRVGETMTIMPDERVRDFSERLEERVRKGLG